MSWMGLRHFLPCAAWALLGCLVVTGTAPAQEIPNLPPDAAVPGVETPPPPAPLEGGTLDDEPQDGVEPLLRGPIHEAFAAPLTNADAQSIVIANKPPAPIEETPPEVKPDDERALWISGYWSWDDDRNDFIWISGVWRVPPPGKRWVPGYWTPEGDQHRWVSGFWTSVERREVEYLPAPPDTLERGPTSDPIAPDAVWISGCWQYRDGRYLWRPGYWSGFREGWVWVPDSYVWTPCGFVFVAGYWDLVVIERGLCYAPVYVAPTVLVRPRFYYCPRVVVNTPGVMLHLFVDTRCRHYCWGDYYADRYVSIGIRPCYGFHFSYGYDPMFAYYNSYYRRQNINYVQHLKVVHNHYHVHADLRPPRTLVERTKFVKEHGDDDHHVTRLTSSTKEIKATGKLREIDDDQRQAFAKQANQVRDLSQNRLSSETKKETGGGANLAGGRRANRLELPDAPTTPRIPKRDTVAGTTGGVGKNGAGQGDLAKLGGQLPGGGTQGGGTPGGAGKNPLATRNADPLGLADDGPKNGPQGGQNSGQNPSLNTGKRSDELKQKLSALRNNGNNSNANTGAGGGDNPTNPRSDLLPRSRTGGGDNAGNRNLNPITGGGNTLPGGNTAKLKPPTTGQNSLLPSGGTDPNPLRNPKKSDGDPQGDRQPRNAIPGGGTVPNLKPNLPNTGGLNNPSGNAPANPLGRSTTKDPAPRTNLPNSFQPGNSGNGLPNFKPNEGPKTDTRRLAPPGGGTTLPNTFSQPTPRRLTNPPQNFSQPPLTQPKLNTPPPVIQPKVAAPKPVVPQTIAPRIAPPPTGNRTAPPPGQGGGGKERKKPK